MTREKTLCKILQPKNSKNRDQIVVTELIQEKLGQSKK